MTTHVLTYWAKGIPGTPEQRFGWDCRCGVEGLPTPNRALRDGEANAHMEEVEHDAQARD